MSPVASESALHAEVAQRLEQKRAFLGVDDRAHCQKKAAQTGGCMTSAIDYLLFFYLESLFCFPPCFFHQCFLDLSFLCSLCLVSAFSMPFSP